MRKFQRICDLLRQEYGKKRKNYFETDKRKERKSSAEGTLPKDTFNDISTLLTILKTLHSDTGKSYLNNPEMARKSVSKIEKILKKL